MVEGHYPALVAGYAAALLGWLTLARLSWAPWPAGEVVRLDHPWRSLGSVLAALVGVMAVGQLFLRGWLLPEGGSLGPIAGAVNQLLIFSPILAVLVLLKEGRDSAWLAPGRVPARIAGGAALALLGLLAYTTLRNGSDGVLVVVARVIRYPNLPFATQVFLEDATIAVLFVRLAAAIGPRRSVALTAVLFAVGHVPAMLAQGDRLGELLLLLRDAALGAAVVAVLMRSRDVLWFWCVHFVMDMTQFPAIVFGT